MGNQASSLPYRIGQTLEEKDDGGWKISEGTKQSNGSRVTVFQCSKLLSSGSKELARHHYNTCKRLRHPMLLKVEATLDTDHPDGGTSSTSSSSLNTEKGDYIIVTEECVSLQEWLLTAPSPQEVAYGLQCMISALSFLHGSAQLSHGNVAPSSWKVTPAGDVKLWNYSLTVPQDELMMGHFARYEASYTPSHYRSPERQAQNYALIQECGIHAMDAYALGILIQTELYPGTVPATLSNALQRLLSPNPKQRPRLQGLLTCPLFQTHYSQLQHDISELYVQNVEAKISFWQNLYSAAVAAAAAAATPTLTPRVALYKLLPILQADMNTILSSESLIQQDLYKRELLAMLHVLFYIWEKYETSNNTTTTCTSSNNNWAPTIGLLFGVQDRAVRGMLLHKLPLLETKLENSTKKQALNHVIFDKMCSGFSDSSPALRELTLKSSLQLVPHLVPTNLEKLSRYLVRLQADTEPSIRTNAVVLIVKVTPRLTAIQQEKLLLPALARGLKDGFEPCRVASLTAILTYKEFIPKDLANKVLPILCPHLLDSSNEIRSKAFQVVQECLRLVEEEHKRMTVLQQQQQQQSEASGGVGEVGDVTAHIGTTSTRLPVTTTTMPAGNGTGSRTMSAASPSSGGASASYLSGLSSWMASSTKPETSSGGAMPTATQQQLQQPLPVTTTSTMTTTTMVRPSQHSLSNTLAATTLNDSWGDDDGDDAGDDDGWGADDNDLLDTASPVTSKTTILPSVLPTRTTDLFSSNIDDEDYFFKSFDTKPATKVAPRTGLSGKKLVIPKKTKTSASATQAPVVTKLNVDKDDWDDF